MSKKKSEMPNVPPTRRRPMTTAEMREMIDEMWALLWEERRIRVEESKTRAKERAEHEARMTILEEDRARADAEHKRASADLQRSMEGLNKRAGDFMENTGRILERNVLKRMKRDGGVGKVKGKVLGPLKKEGEYDGAVINGKQTLVLEIKRNLRLSDVRDFLRRRLPRFARDFPDLAEGRKIYGAMAFELDADDGKAAELARENGLMLVQVSDRKGIKALNPDPAQLRPIQT